jgi:hypothetical protein
VFGLRAAAAAGRDKHQHKREETTNHDDPDNYTAAA